MYKAIVFAGTTEGYEICRFLSANKISALACVATEYGSHSLEAGDYLKIQAKRLDEQEMTELFHKELPEFILDATHPYATEVTKNIKSAALASGISYIRVLRAESQSQNAVYVETAEQAVEYLRDREGRIFLTTEVKNWQLLRRYRIIGKESMRVYFHFRLWLKPVRNLALRENI